MSFFFLLALVLPAGRPTLDEVLSVSELGGDGGLSSEDNDGLLAELEDDERLDAVVTDELVIISLGGDSTAAVNILFVRIFNAEHVISTPIWARISTVARYVDLLNGFPVNAAALLSVTRSATAFSVAAFWSYFTEVTISIDSVSTANCCVCVIVACEWLTGCCVM